MPLPGEVWIADIPFTSGTASKLRPVLVLWTDSADVVVAAVKAGVPVPAFSSAVAYYDSYRSETLPANLVQAQRDFFGAHTYERLDKPRGEFFHTNWTGHGGTTTSRSYNV